MAWQLRPGAVANRRPARVSQEPIAVPPLASMRSTARLASARVCGEAIASVQSVGYTARATSVPAMTPKATPSRMQSIATEVA